MLFTHGWGGNRFQHEDKMAWAVDRFDLVCVSVEFRQSGYDFDPVRGCGSCVPYDAGFYQVFDVLNGLRHVLQQRPGINRHRLFHYGGSQGGQIALLSAMYAPATFAWAYVSCPLTHLDDHFQQLAGRCFSGHELAVRAPLDMVKSLRCPVYLEYGDADTTVPCEPHGRTLAQRLDQACLLAHRIEYAGAEHDLTPTTTKLDAFQAMSQYLDWDAVAPAVNDFDRGMTVNLACRDSVLVIDWSRPTDDAALVRWEPGGIE